MSIPVPPVNKRTMLGGQYWLVAAAGALALQSLPLAVALTVAGAHLVLAPAFRSRQDESSKFLLRAE